MKHILKTKEMGILVITLVLTMVITLNNNIFIRPDNIIDMLKSNTVLGILAVGMLLIIVTGGIDVSVSASVAAVTVIIGKFAVNYGGNLFAIFLVGCASGVMMGAINGLLIAKLKLPPIVATLGMMSIINGLMLYYTNGTWINDIPEYFINFGKMTLFSIPDGQGGTIGIPIQILFLIFAALLTWFIAKYTLVGRGIYAMGGNSVSAARIGYNLDGITIFLYSYMGFLVGIAGVVHTSIMKQVDPNAFWGFELQVIAPVVLGGASVMGGSGSVFGTILGVLLFSIMNNGLIIMHIPVFWQKIVVGLIIIAVVSIDVMQKKREESKRTRVDVDEELNEVKGCREYE